MAILNAKMKPSMLLKECIIQCLLCSGEEGNTFLLKYLDWKCRVRVNQEETYPVYDMKGAWQVRKTGWFQSGWGVCMSVRVCVCVCVCVAGDISLSVFFSFF